MQVSREKELQVLFDTHLKVRQLLGLLERDRLATIPLLAAHSSFSRRSRSNALGLLARYYGIPLGKTAVASLQALTLEIAITKTSFVRSAQHRE